MDIVLIDQKIPTDKNRIMFVDLAKGFCIILVVLVHSGLTLRFNTAANSFRMPLYFVLSGLFFKSYDGFKDFLRRKTNKLLVPFIFWHLIFSFFLQSYFDWRREGVSIVRSIFLKCLDVVYLGGLNYPIWFLFALFVTNIIFYGILNISVKFSKFRGGKFGQILGVIILSVFCGFCGWLLRIIPWHLPMLREVSIPYLGSALSAMPFFAGGYLLRKNTTVLSSPISWKTILLIVVGIIPLFVLAYLNVSTVAFRINKVYVNTMLMYFLGFTGTLFILMLSKILGHLPFVSYLGRYSIIVLVLHAPVMCLFTRLASGFIGKYPSNCQNLMTFVVATVVCFFMIPVCKKYLPHVTAQKDIF